MILYNILGGFHFPFIRNAITPFFFSWNLISFVNTHGRYDKTEGLDFDLFFEVISNTMDAKSEKKVEKSAKNFFEKKS